MEELSMNITAFSSRLNSAMSQKFVNGNMLSEATGINKDTISNYRHGTIPTVINAMKIANELEVSMDWLCGMNAPAPATAPAPKVVSRHGLTFKDRAKKIIDYYNQLQPGDFFTTAIIAEKTGITRVQINSVANYNPGLKELFSATRVRRNLYRKPQAE